MLVDTRDGDDALMADSAPQLTAILIDDHQLFSSGLQFLLEEHLSFRELSAHVDPRSAKAAIAAYAEDVDMIITDFYMPGYDPADFIPDLRKCAPRATIICVSATLSAEDEQRARDLGADAFIGKHIPPAVLAQTIIDLVNGAEPTRETQLTAPPFAAAGLTVRQGEIVVLVAQGRSNKEIACALGLSPETVKAHLATIFREHELSNRIELIGWARRRGLMVNP